MENQLQIFSNPDFGDIRAIEIDGKPLFVGRDIAQALGYSDTKKALQDHVPDKFKCIINAKILQQMASQSKGGGMATFDFDSPRGLTFITEAGVYKLIFRSKLPNAEKFSDWVCEDVMPRIRKDGYYSVSDTIQAAPAVVITDFERGRELAKLACAAQRGYVREILIAKAANLLAGENLFDLNDIGGTKALADKTADKKDLDEYKFEPTYFDIGDDTQSIRYALTLGKWKRKKK